MTLNLLMALTRLCPLVGESSTGEKLTGAGTGIGIGLLALLKVLSQLAVGVVDPLLEGDRAMPSGMDPRRPARGRVSDTRRPVFWLTRVMVRPRSRGGS